MLHSHLLIDGHPALTSSLQETQSQFSSELRLIQDRIDMHTAQVRDISNQQKHLTTQLESTQARLRQRQERKQKLQNLRQRVSELRSERPPQQSAADNPENVRIGDADKEFEVLSSSSPQALQSRLSAYNSLNARLAAHVTQLKSKDGELEAKYRKVIALCTGVDEKEVDAVLGQLVQAVESEVDVGQDVSRVREFLRRVEMAS